MFLYTNWKTGSIRSSIRVEILFEIYLHLLNSLFSWIFIFFIFNFLFNHKQLLHTNNWNLHQKITWSMKLWLICLRLRIYFILRYKYRRMHLIIETGLRNVSLCWYGSCVFEYGSNLGPTRSLLALFFAAFYHRQTLRWNLGTKSDLTMTSFLCISIILIRYCVRGGIRSGIQLRASQILFE